jgi:predicted sulfurtransferase
LLFYQYVHPLWTTERYQQIHDYLLQIGLVRTNVAGRIRIAKEGLNVTLSAIDSSSSRIDTNDDGTPNNNDNDPKKGNRYCADAITTLHYFVEDLLRFDMDHTFAQTDFKYVTNLTHDRHFASYQIIPVQELVHYGGLNDQNASIVQYGGTHVTPTEFHHLLAGDDIEVTKETLSDPSPTTNIMTTTTTTQTPKKGIVVIDVRNHYEAVLGRFDGQVEQNNRSSSCMDATTDTMVTKNVKTAAAAAVAAHTTNTNTVAAKYMDPKMRKSTDFPQWVQENVHELMHQDRILLYCTGGIRCERASAHLKSIFVSKQKEIQQQQQHGPMEEKKDVHQDHIPEIYQLQGGIEKYLQTFPDGGFWRGKNFTFDKREAISIDNWNGDGGVVLPKKKVSKNQNTTGSTTTTSATDGTNSDVKLSSSPSQRPTGFTSAATTPLPECQCVVCHVHWDRYIGKKKCCTCGVPILVCDTCLSTKSKHVLLQNAKCPLCVEEHITIPVSALAYTNNGVQAKVISDTAVGRPSRSDNNQRTMEYTMLEDSIDLGSNTTTVAMTCVVPKASTTVLKWGGGHGKKGNSKTTNVNNVYDRPCKFGRQCHRPDCCFVHPTK